MKNQLKSGVTLSYITLILSNLILIIYTPFMLRLLGQSDYGLYQLVNSFVSYLGLLSFGLSSAYVRYFSIYKVKNDYNAIARLSGMFITVFSVTAIIAIAAGGIMTANVGAIFGDRLEANEIGRAKILMLLLVFNIAVSFPMSVFNCYITANEKYVFQKLLQLIKTVVSPFVTLPLLILGYGSVGLVAATVAVNLVVEVANAVFCVSRLKMRFIFRSFDFALLREIFVFCSFIFINIIVDQVNWSIDKFLLGIFRGTGAVAVYGIAAQLNTCYQTFSTSISSVFIPRINRIAAGERSKNGKNEMTQLFTKVGRIQFAVLSLLLSGFIFFGRPFVFMWAGENYAESYLITLILIIPVTIPLLQNLGIDIQRAMNMHRFRSIVYLGIAAANVLISIPLCKAFGAVGCAAGTAAALIVGNIIIMNIYYERKIGISMAFFWKNILKMLPSCVLPTAAGVIISINVNLYSPVRFVLWAAVYSVIFCASMWFFGLNQYEKGLVKSPLIMLASKFHGKK